MIADHQKAGEAASNDGVEEGAENKAMLDSAAFESMDWWPGLADLDRITILNAPIEDRARLLASKY